MTSILLRRILDRFAHAPARPPPSFIRSFETGAHYFRVHARATPGLFFTHFLSITPNASDTMVTNEPNFYRPFQIPVFF